LRKVEQAIRGRNDSRLRDLDMMGVFNHTGQNEALNSLHNKVRKARAPWAKFGSMEIHIFNIC
jgi:hypothetical protein